MLLRLSGRLRPAAILMKITHSLCGISIGCGRRRPLSEEASLVLGQEKGYRHEAFSHAIATIERLGRKRDRGLRQSGQIPKRYEEKTRVQR